MPDIDKSNMTLGHFSADFSTESFFVSFILQREIFQLTFQPNLFFGHFFGFSTVLLFFLFIFVSIYAFCAVTVSIVKVVTN